ncbi:MAG: HEAT repeat domain-containing protein [Planctomycetaceae bacterium]
MTGLGDCPATAPSIAVIQKLALHLPVIKALGELGDHRAVTPLIKWRICFDDLSYLDKERNSVVGRALDDAIKQLEAPAVEALITLLKDSHHSVRGAAAMLLGELHNPEAVDPLIELLQDSDGRVLARTAISLGQLGDSRALQPLLERLSHSESRRGIAEALGVLGDTRAVEPLIECLSRPKDSATHETIVALGKLNDPRAVAPLMKFLTDSDYGLRCSTATALGNLGDTAAVEPLIDLLEDEKSMVQEQAAAALAKINDVRSVEPLVSALQKCQGAEEVYTSGGTIHPYMPGKPFHDALVVMLQSKPETVPDEQLGSIVVLQDINSLRTYIKDDCGIKEETKRENFTDDLSGLRQLARQELARRKSSQARPEKAAPASRTLQPILATCSGCQQKFRIAPKHAGRRTNCPKCKAQIDIPMT